MPRALSLAALSLALGFPLFAPAPALAGPLIDGRLNPEPGEYYTLYCDNDLLEVWRELPAVLLITPVGLLPVFLLEEGAELPLLEDMILRRDGADTMILSGSNGSAAPAPGQKAFSLSECIARNGQIPGEPDPKQEPPTEAQLVCRTECIYCIRCLLGDPPCVESPSQPGYEPWCYLEQQDCPILCLEACDELPAPAGTAGKSRAAPPAPAPKARPDPGSSALELLYAVRDLVLGPTPAGRRYRGLYYEHQREIHGLLVSNWGRWNEGLATLIRFQPHLLALVEGRGSEVVVSAADVAAVEEFLDHLASPATPELAGVLAAERSEAQLAQLVGKTAEEARAIFIGAASCPEAPDPACTAGFAKGSLVVDERKAGREKLVARIGGGPGLAQADFGDPTAPGPGDVSLCLYDGAGVRAGALGVARAGEICGRKPCWKALGGPAPGGSGFAYKDKLGFADGFRSIALKGGAAGKASLAASAANKARKLETRLPDGIAADLGAATEVTLQLRTEAGCFSIVLDEVLKQQAGLFKARAR